MPRTPVDVGVTGAMYIYPPREWVEKNRQVDMIIKAVPL
jgi:hypothetical protein